MPLDVKEKELIPPVFISSWDTTCIRCRTDLAAGALYTFEGKSHLCVRCSGLSGLVVLPSGMAELTRIAGSYSPRKYAILRWVQGGRWSRVGMLAEPQAVARAARELQDRLVAIVESQMLADDANMARTIRFSPSAHPAPFPTPDADESFVPPPPPPTFVTP